MSLKHLYLFRQWTSWKKLSRAASEAGTISRSVVQPSNLPATSHLAMISFSLVNIYRHDARAAAPLQLTVLMLRSGFVRTMC